MATMSPEMEKAQNKWRTAWGKGGEESPQQTKNISKGESDPPPEIEFTADEINSFVIEFDEMAADSLEIETHPTFAKFLGKLSVPVVRKYSRHLDKAPEKIAVIFWLAYIALIYMEWQASQVKASEDSEDSDEVQKRENF